MKYLFTGILILIVHLTLPATVPVDSLQPDWARYLMQGQQKGRQYTVWITPRDSSKAIVGSLRGLDRDVLTVATYDRSRHGFVNRDIKASGIRLLKTRGKDRVGMGILLGLLGGVVGGGLAGYIAGKPSCDYCTITARTWAFVGAVAGAPLGLTIGIIAGTRKKTWRLP